jgi:dTDP-4-amino-4,6-dideoxygalactose transaminase
LLILYRKELADVRGISYLNEPEDTDSNFAYFPIYINEDEYGMSRDDLYEKLKQSNIYGRRYFYPLISEFPMYKGLDSSRKENLPVANKMAEMVICLPIYPDLELSSVKQIARVIKH